MSFEYDLIVLVADADAEWTIRTLLDTRAPALHIRQINSKVIRDPGRDPGVYLRAQDLLQPYLNQAAYALVMLDREGSGREAKMSALAMEQDLENRLQESGWRTPNGQPRAAAVVLDPELEVWVWSRSPHVAAALGLDENSLAAVLQQVDRLPNGKPKRPKQAMLTALRAGRKPHSPQVFQELARNVSLQAHERAFDKLRHTLQTWFPLQEGAA